MVFCKISFSKVLFWSKSILGLHFCRSSRDLVTILICEREKMSNIALKKLAKKRSSTGNNEY